jgi:hypothetical protein
VSWGRWVLTEGVWRDAQALETASVLAAYISNAGTGRHDSSESVMLTL